MQITGWKHGNRVRRPFSRLHKLQPHAVPANRATHSLVRRYTERFTAESWAQMCGITKIIERLIKTRQANLTANIRTQNVRRTVFPKLNAHQALAVRDGNTGTRIKLTLRRPAVSECTSCPGVRPHWERASPDAQRRKAHESLQSSSPLRFRLRQGFGGQVNECASGDARSQSRRRTPSSPFG
jgi:hypothetical protein